MFKIPFEWLEVAFKCFECCLNGSNLHSNASNLVRMVRIPFFKGSNLHSNCSNFIGMVRICIRLVRIPFEWFEYRLNNSNLHSNV